MKYVLAIMAALLVSFVLALTGQAAVKDNYGGVNSKEYQKNASAVYHAFASRWGSNVGRTMVRCMNRESHGNRFAANYHDSNGGSYGLLQLNGVHRWASETMDQFRLRMWTVKTHLEAAVRLFASAKLDPHTGYNGFSPWGGGC